MAPELGPSRLNASLGENNLEMAQLPPSAVLSLVYGSSVTHVRERVLQHAVWFYVVEERSTLDWRGVLSRGSFVETGDHARVTFN